MERLYLGHPPTPSAIRHHISTMTATKFHNIAQCCLFLFLILICFLQLNISFNDKTEVFEYPSFEPVSPVQTMDMVQSSEEEPDVVSRLKSNTPVGSSGDTSFMSEKQCNILNSLLCPVKAG